MAAVQFNHRIGAYLLAGGAVWFYLIARKHVIERPARLVLAAIGFQIVLGVWTVLSATPIALGLAHQAGALMVFAAALYTAHGARG
jgi:cytochrome c oxidase assembly protein subunit 15